MRGERKLCVHEPKEMGEFTYVLTGDNFLQNIGSRASTAEHVAVKSESENITLILPQYVLNAAKSTVL
jgi:hypothetical protein